MKPAKRTEALPIVAELRSVRRKQNLRRDVLAEIMGYHWQTLGRWERGESLPSCQALHDWCQALGVTLALASQPEFSAGSYLRKDDWLADRKRQR